MYELVSERHELVDPWREVFAAFVEDRSDPDRAWQDLLDRIRYGVGDARTGPLLDWLDSLPDDDRARLASDTEREPLFRRLAEQPDDDLAGCFAVFYQWRDGDRHVDGDVAATPARESSWDEARQRYVSFDPESQQWQAWDDTAGDWGPLDAEYVSEPAAAPEPEPAPVAESAPTPTAEPVSEEVRQLSETVIGPAMDALYDDLPALAASLGVEESEVQAVLDALPAEFFADIAAETVAD